MEFRARKIEGGFIDGLGEFQKYPKDFQEEEQMEDGLLENCFSYDDYKFTDDMNIDLEDNEKELESQVDLDVDVDVNHECSNKRGKYKRYDETVKDEFFDLVIEQGISAYRAAKDLRIKLQTAYTWKRNENRRIWNIFNGIEEEPKKRGRKPLPTEEYKDFLLEYIKKDSTVSLEDMLVKLKEKFKILKATISTLYRFVRKVCKLILKRISKWPIARNTPENLEKRYEWAIEYKDKLDFLENCVFIDEAGFNIGMTREYGWSEIGKKAVVETKAIRGVNVSVLGAISSKGCIQMKVRNLGIQQSSKKRKLNSDTSVSVSKGTNADHFYSFIKSLLQQISSTKNLKGLKYLVLDSASIHQSPDVQLLVKKFGLDLVFLPLYSPCLNAIEEFLGSV